MGRQVFAESGDLCRMNFLPAWWQVGNYCKGEITKDLSLFTTLTIQTIFKMVTER